MYLLHSNFALIAQNGFYNHLATITQVKDKHYSTTTQCAISCIIPLIHHVVDTLYKLKKLIVFKPQTICPKIEQSNCMTITSSCVVILENLNFERNLILQNEKSKLSSSQLSSTQHQHRCEAQQNLQFANLFGTIYASQVSQIIRNF